MRKFYLFCVLAAVTMLHTGCFLLTSGPSTPSSYETKPTVDYAPQMLKNGAYISFTRPDGEYIKIVFQTQNTADLAACSTGNGRINAAYYRYDGFNMSSLTYNYSPNGGLSSQYKAELNFTSETGGNILFLDSNETRRFTFRP